MIAFQGEINERLSRSIGNCAADVFLQAVAAHDLSDEMQRYVDMLLCGPLTSEEVQQLVRLQRNICRSQALLRGKIIELYRTMLL
jgi:hypothetical protein